MEFGLAQKVGNRITTHFLQVSQNMVSGSIKALCACLLLPLCSTVSCLFRQKIQKGGMSRDNSHRTYIILCPGRCLTKTKTVPTQPVGKMSSRRNCWCPKARDLSPAASGGFHFRKMPSATVFKSSCPMSSLTSDPRNPNLFLTPSTNMKLQVVSVVL